MCLELVHSMEWGHAGYNDALLSLCEGLKGLSNNNVCGPIYFKNKSASHLMQQMLRYLILSPSVDQQ